MWFSETQFWPFPLEDGSNSWKHILASIGQCRKWPEMVYAVRLWTFRLSCENQPGPTFFPLNFYSAIRTAEVKILPFYPAAAAAAKLLQYCPTLRPHRRQPTRLPPSLGFSRQEHWSGLPFPAFPAFLQCMKVKSESEVSQSPFYPRLPLFSSFILDIQRELKVSHIKSSSGTCWFRN